MKSWQKIGAQDFIFLRFYQNSRAKYSWKLRNLQYCIQIKKNTELNFIVYFKIKIKYIAIWSYIPYLLQFSKQ